MAQTITGTHEKLLSPTTWTDLTSRLRTFCDTRLSINQTTTYRWTLRDALKQYPRAGVGGIGLWRQKLDEFEREEAVELLQQSEIRPTSLAWAGGFPGANGFTYDEAVADGEDCIDLADALGVPVVLIASGARGNHILSHAKRSSFDAMSQLGDYAGERGIRLAVMPMRSTNVSMSMLHELENAVDLIERWQHEAIFLAFHTYHLGDTPNVVERIPSITPYVASVHISDYKPTTQAFDQHAPGTGELPLAEIVQAFDRSGYAGAFEIDIWSDRLWKTDPSSLVASCVRHFHENLLTHNIPTTEVAPQGSACQTPAREL